MKRVLTAEQRSRSRLSWQKWYQSNRSKKIAWQARRRDEMREWIASMKESLACLRCGESHPGCLVFHHRDPDTKSFALGDALSFGWSKARLLAEIAKCDVFCANCHAKFHRRNGV